MKKHKKPALKRVPLMVDRWFRQIDLFVYQKRLWFQLERAIFFKRCQVTKKALVKLMFDPNPKHRLKNRNFRK